METILEINNLYKNYGKIKAVQDLSLKVSPGNVFGLLGPNGSGKTTTLGVILNVVNQNSGDYKWFDKAPSKESRKKIGAILEAPSFYPYLSATNNLKVIARIKNTPYKRIDEVLEKVGLIERKNDRFQTYSLGMKQRLAIASALLSDPFVLVLDEPTNGLDPQGIADVRELIIKISGEGKTIILASHLLDEVQKVCSHFAVLNKGKVLYTGSVEEALSSKESVEVSAPDLAGLLPVVSQFEFCKNAHLNGQKIIVQLDQGKTSLDLNSYLVSKGIVVSHLATERKNLEEQFLEILSQAK
jgi:ABC-type multidrug transport system ATPase subunit